jgi:transposase-like protein
VVMEAYVHGVSTRKVDDLVAALGLESGSPSPRSPGSARSSTSSSEPSDRARWPTWRSPTCSWTPPI